jgi:hypothetical protein
MPRLVKGDHAVETELPREVVRYKSLGYKVEKARTKRVKQADAAREEAAAQETQVYVHPAPDADTNVVTD